MHHRSSSRSSSILFHVVVVPICLFSPLAVVNTRAQATGPLTRESVLDRLRTVPPYRAPLDLPVSAGEQVGYWFFPCIKELLFLSSLPASVDSELEALATDSSEIHLRCRGMMALVMRGNEKGIGIATKWMRSDRGAERVAGWESLEYCPTKLDDIVRVLPVDTILEMYRHESDPEVRKAMERFFGQRKARFAVDALCRTLADGDRRTPRTIADIALAQIGDRRAVVPLIRSQISPNAIVWALGRIADEEGADYVIDHLNLPGAPIALARIGGSKALPALRSALERLKRGEVPQGVHSPHGYLRDQIDELHLAILLLTSKEPQNALLDAAEAPKNSLRYRRLALEELSRLGISRIGPRFLAFYRSVMPTVLGTSCITVFEGNTSEQVTSAMKSHQLVLEALRAKSSLESDDSVLSGADLSDAESVLLFALHKRIGNDVFRQQAKERQECM